MPAIGTYRHLVTLENPGTAVPDGDGGYTQQWTPLDPPTWHVSITPATVRDLERVQAGTVASTATHLVRGRHHPQITTETRLLFNGRRLNVIFVGNPEERDLFTDCVCVEQVE